jgi:thiamine biosynthesis protein ThiS
MSTRGLEATTTEGSIRLRVNGSDRVVPAGETVRGLLERLDLVPETIVVEHNLEILDRASYERVLLREGDRLELVHFVGGG